MVRSNYRNALSISKSGSAKVAITEENWEPEIGLAMIGGEARKEQRFLRAYRNYFAFNLKDLGTLKGPGIRIELTNDTPIFRRPYKYSDLERSLIQARTTELWEAGLVELSNGEYASTIVMPAKKDIFENWTERRMCRDYRPMNCQTKSDRYAMPTPEEIFDVIGHSKVLNTLDLRFGYHQLPIREVDKEKTAFWGINEHKKDRLYQWKFLPFGLKNAPAEF